ncbi:MAG: malto-oligosyltrehalose trehalohydrolase [Alphaproteobacteria bacterium]|nr:malto-oligosyltrehalose trehalohydrolase [Alphaproteobacteria bacterium]
MEPQPEFGPRMEGDQVRFALWAPDAAEVVLVVEDRRDRKMQKLADGWYGITLAGGAGLRYRFRIDDTLCPDPAARRQEGGPHGWSVVTAPERPDSWRGRPWHETVLYECHAGLMGGFTGVAERLPALAQIGITAIELMPIAAFPGGRNWGYDGVLPYAVAEAYGTLAELRALLAKAHALGTSVLLDVVYNHFGPDGNFLPLYASRFFRDDVQTPWGPAIDFRVPQVRRFFADNARYWLFEVGFDGLRFDAVHAMADDGWLDELAMQLKREGGQRPVHLVLENEHNQAHRLRQGFDAQWNDDIHHAVHVMLTGEEQGYYQDFAEEPAVLLAKALKDGFIYQGQASHSRDGAPRGEFSGDLDPTAFIDFLQNHDQTGNRALGERLSSLTSTPALKAAAALQLLSPHIPMLFMGEECGSQTPFLYFTDHGPELAAAVREGRRREFAAFHNQGAAIPDPNDAATFAASDPWREAPQAQAWQEFYHDLLTLRQKWIVPRLPGAGALGAQALGDKAVMARWRMGDGWVLTLACNLGNEPVSAALLGDEPFYGEKATEIAPATTLAWLTAP